MDRGPFQDDINAELIPKFLMKELFPSLKRIRKLCTDTWAIDRGLLKSIDRRETNRCIDDYRAAAKEFLDLYIKWNTPDDFYSNLDEKVSNNHSRMGGILQEYYNYRTSIQPHFDEGFRLLDQIDRSLSSLNTSSFARLSLAASLVAVVISVIAILATGSGGQ